MAVASDIPQIENEQQYKHELANSFLYDDHWRPIGLFAPPNNVVIDYFKDISPSMQDAIVSIEDKRFWTNPGVDIRGIGRAFFADVTGNSRQGASTIAQQFVKNALSEQGNRTVFEKLREAALAYHLTREWTKEKILTEYLNSIYFGNGAYGIESAARVYFGSRARVPSGDRFGGGDHFHRRPANRAPDAATARTTSSCPSARRSWRRGSPRCSRGWWPRRPRLTRSCTPSRPACAATSCCRTCTSSTTSAASSTSRASTSRSPRQPTSSSPASRRWRPTSRAGCARRSSRRWASGEACRPALPSTARTSAG